MRLFDVYLAIDWSAKSEKTSPIPCADAVWAGERCVDGNLGISESSERYFRTRFACHDYLRRRLLEHARTGRRVFVGFDFAYGYPAGFCDACGLTGVQRQWRRVWNELARLIVDDHNNVNNRFEVAGDLNVRCGGSRGPFWGCPNSRETPSLGRKGVTYPFLSAPGVALEVKRETEKQMKGVQPTWKLLGNGTVGSQALLGIPVVAALRDDPALNDFSRVWPFETGFALPSTPPGQPFILHVEIWPGVVNDRLDPSVPIRDQAQMRAMVEWLDELDTAGRLSALFDKPPRLSPDRVKKVVDEEGWIFGAGL